MISFYKLGLYQAICDFLKHAEISTPAELVQQLEAVRQLPKEKPRSGYVEDLPGGMPKDPPGFGFSFPPTTGFSYDLGRAGMYFTDIGDASVS